MVNNNANKTMKGRCKMNDYPIEGLMNSAMNSIKEMIDVDTIIGEPIETSNNVVIIPVSRVNFGFAAGGSEFKVKSNIKTKEDNEKEENDKKRLPFGGGSGAGVSISPIAFIVVQESGVKLLPVEHTSAVDKLLDLVPDLIDKTTQMLDKQLKKMEKKSEDNIIVKVSENTNNKANLEKANKSSEKDGSNENKKSGNEPSTVVKIESKPYDIEYDETDM